MKRFKKIGYVLGIICILIIGSIAIVRAKNVPYERDEISWYFHTKFFDEAFIKKDLRSSLWDGYENFDHPQMSKYIYGRYLYFHNRDYASMRDALEKKYGRWNFYTAIKSDQDISTTEFASVIMELREINTVLTFFILAEIFVLFYMLSGSIIFSFLTSLVFVVNDLFINSTAVVTSDNHVLFFSLLAMILYFRSITSKRLLWIIAASVITAFSVGTKLIGIFLFVSVILNEMIRLIYDRISIAQTLKRVVFYISVGIFVWIVINPSLYVHPIQNTWRYFDFRSFQSANIAYHVPEAALHTGMDRVRAITCTVLILPCKSHWARGSISSNSLFNVSLFLLGLWYSQQAIRKKKSEIIFLILLGYVICLGYIANLSNYSWRYFVHLQIVVFFIQMFGAWSLLKYLTQKLFSISLFHERRR